MCAAPGPQPPCLYLLLHGLCVLLLYSIVVQMVGVLVRAGLRGPFEHGCHRRISALAVLGDVLTTGAVAKGLTGVTGAAYLLHGVDCRSSCACCAMKHHDGMDTCLLQCMACCRLACTALCTATSTTCSTYARAAVMQLEHRVCRRTCACTPASVIHAIHVAAGVGLMHGCRVMAGSACTSWMVL